MSHILRFSAAEKSPRYIALVQVACDRITRTNRFSKAEALKDAKLNDFDTNAFQWKHIIRMIENRLGVELVPMARAFFLKHDPEDEIKRPERYMAQGAGKRAVGWINAEAFSHVILRKLEYKRHQTVGAAEAANRSYQSAHSSHADVPGHAYPYQLAEDLREREEARAAERKVITTEAKEEKEEEE